MNIVYQTDERLKSYLDTNQLARERICTALLAIDKRFSNVRPRHPRGGPDGGRDIDAIFNGRQVAFGAVGFVNQANDSDGHKKKAQNKFSDDLEVALAAAPTPQVFVFFTNVNLTLGEKEALESEGRKRGILHCEIFDRERMRVLLDSTDGYGIRIAHLGIPLSEAEQAAFFARWGDGIQSVISEGFGEVTKALRRMQFLFESNFLLQRFNVVLELDREYEKTEIDHFRFYCYLTLPEPRSTIFKVLFGTTDNYARKEVHSDADLQATLQRAKEGLCPGHWEQRMEGWTTPRKQRVRKAKSASETDERWKEVSVGSATREEKTKALYISFGYENFLLRFPPYLLLSDLDGANYLFYSNKSLFGKIRSIQVFANEYKMAEYAHSQLRAGEWEHIAVPPLWFSQKELSDPWVRIMNDPGPFSIRFSRSTPSRIVAPEHVAPFERCW